MSIGINVFIHQDKHKGLPLLMAHGLAANTYWWHRMIPLLPKSLHSAAFDFRGHGDSPWLESGEYSPQIWIDDIETVRQKLGWDRFVLCGHSMGARISLEYAMRYPQHLHAVIAIDFLTDIRMDKSSRFARMRKRTQPLYPDQEKMLQRFRLEPDGTVLSSSELIDLARHCIRREENGYTWKFDWRSILHQRLGALWPHLPKIKVPSLIIRGEHSTILLSDELDRLSNELKGCQTVEIAGAHHHVPLDKPMELAHVIAQFIERQNISHKI